MAEYLELLCNVSKMYPKPREWQTTLAATSVNPSSHTVPQTPLWITSRRPSRGLGPPTNLSAYDNFLNLCDEVQQSTYFTYMIIMSYSPAVDYGYVYNLAVVQPDFVTIKTTK